jgi:hypothetical protein
MRNASLLWGLAILAGCGSPPPDPIDPKAIRLVVDPSGAYSHAGRTLTRETLDALVPVPESRDSSYRHTLILLNVAPGMKMALLRRTIEDLVRIGCVNIAFRDQAWPIQLPIVSELCGHLSVFDGQSMVRLVDGQETLEVVAQVGIGGAIRVSGVANNRDYVWFPEKPGDQSPDFSWQGPRPDYGIWSVETLRDFLNRPEVARRTPYVGLEIAWSDDVADVLRCLSALREAAGSRVEPILKAE